MHQKALMFILIGACFASAQETVAAPGPNSNPRPLQLVEAVKTALKNNLQVQIADSARNLIHAGIDIQAGAFDWNVNGTFGNSRQDLTSSKPPYPGAALQDIQSTNWRRSLAVGLDRTFTWGGLASVIYQNGYDATTGTILNGQVNPVSGAVENRPFATAAPYYGSMSLFYSQSLLRNRGWEIVTSPLMMAKKSAMAADSNFEKNVIGIIAHTEALYWDLAFDYRNLENKKDGLRLARELLEENLARVKAGTLAPIEVTQTRATVATREQEIIIAETQLLNDQDALQKILYPDLEAAVSLEPADPPRIVPVEESEAAAEQIALARRAEIKAADAELGSKEIAERVAENRLLPQLDAYISYTGASNNHSAVGAVNGDLGGFKLPGYAMGFRFSLPLGNRTAKGNLASARANLRQGELALRDLKLAIRLEVRQAYRTLKSFERTIIATKETRKYREEDYGIERRKFEIGMGTNFNLLSKQNDLDTAKKDELYAQIGYMKALSIFRKATGDAINNIK